MGVSQSELFRKLFCELDMKILGQSGRTRFLTASFWFSGNRKDRFHYRVRSDELKNNLEFAAESGDP